MGKKLKTSVALDEDLLKWIDKEIKTKRFASRSHAIEFAIESLRKEK
jgi:Arc/MetJ-type ribon-helix-helix transcriptional regulator